MFKWLRKLYDWVLGFAESRYGPWALFLVAVAESSFFPIPPDILLIALAIGVPIRSFRLALICTVGSLTGAVIGYFIGLEFYSLIGQPIIEFYSIQNGYDRVRQLYHEWDAVAVVIAGFTPIPYKVFTIAAGAFEINFATFMLASAVGRGGRFFLVAALIRWLGPSVKDLIDRYFNLCTILFVILALGGFLIVKYVI